MEDTYLTLHKPAEGVYRDKGSRFLAFGFPVKNEAEIRDILTFLRKKYHDARHHCYAYRLGAAGDVFRVNDDGEPSGTAGKPIYGQLLSTGITQVLVVVVRYFGGTLLGTGGLIQAYRSASADMLANAEKITRHVETRIRITFPYEAMNAVMKVLKEEAVIPEEHEYQSTCTVVVSVRAGISVRLSERVTSIPGTVCESLQTDD